jgi:hypothetical protein
MNLLIEKGVFRFAQNGVSWPTNVGIPTSWNKSLFFPDSCVAMKPPISAPQCAPGRHVAIDDPSWLGSVCQRYRSCAKGLPSTLIKFAQEALIGKPFQ